jgi:S-adenosylmethionine hydrolase
MKLITLLTDFGTEDEYTGVMKGVILSIYPDVTIADITHAIAPQDIVQAAYLLESAYKYFPKRTIHTVVVDPGVGSERAILAVKTDGHIFLAPDNGILSLITDKQGSDTVIRVENSAYFLESVSQTFHGRDIFAPVAAHIAKGLDITELGTCLNETDIVRLSVSKPHLSNKGELVGTIVSADRFGNLITNIDSKALEPFFKAEFHIGKGKIAGLSQAYASVAKGESLAILGSRGYLEISVNCGNAQKYFGVEKGDAVRIRPHKL